MYSTSDLTPLPTKYENMDQICFHIIPSFKTGVFLIRLNIFQAYYAKDFFLNTRKQTRLHMLIMRYYTCGGLVMPRAQVKE